jgi:hypothetical protein
VPFLRLTRDRRGFENTFLMHADRPGDRPRLLYWYRTAPGIALGRAPLDEDAIRTIEEQHPDIEFDWPAILALSEVMMPEEEAAPARPQKSSGRKPPRESARREQTREPRRDERVDDAPDAVEPAAQEQASDVAPAPTDDVEPDLDERDEEPMVPAHHHVSALLEELVGREIATRLRARYSEIQARIHEQQVEPAQRDEWLKRAEALNPDLWLTPDAILEGVRSADNLFARLHGELKK